MSCATDSGNVSCLGHILRVRSQIGSQNNLRCTTPIACFLFYVLCVVSLEQGASSLRPRLTLRCCAADALRVALDISHSSCSCSWSTDSIIVHVCFTFHGWFAFFVVVGSKYEVGLIYGETGLQLLRDRLAQEIGKLLAGEACPYVGLPLSLKSVWLNWRQNTDYGRRYL